MGMCESENKQSEITNEEMIQKQNELKTICLQLKLNPSQIFNSEFLEIIINHSETKDGFISNEIREILYQYLFNVKIINKTTKFEYCTLIIDDEKKLKYYHNFINWKISNLDTINSNNLSIINDPDTIKKDIPRGIIDINSIQSNFSYKNNLEKSTFSKFTFFSTKTFNYNYYQGCLFIYFYFLHLYKDNTLIGISCLQKYFELFLKDFLLDNTNEQINSIIQIINDLIKIISPKISNIFEKYNIFPNRSIELILTSFIKEDSFANYQENKFRILDFLICHKPYYSFLLCAFYFILITENIISNESSDDDMSDLLIEGLQNYSFNKDDYDNIIMRTVNFDKNNFNEVKNVLNKYQDIFKYMFHNDNNGLISYLNKNNI